MLKHATHRYLTATLISQFISQSYIYMCLQYRDTDDLLRCVVL